MGVRGEGTAPTASAVPVYYATLELPGMWAKMMIAYHHTDGGMPNVDLARFVRGRAGLVSWQYPQTLGLCLDYAREVLLDNGAYTIWQRGEGRLDVEGYISWLRTDSLHRHPRVTAAIIPDVIGGTEEENDRLLDAWPSDICGWPVWHPHESAGRLARLCDAFDTVCIGGSGQYPVKRSHQWLRRMADVMDATCDAQGRPPARLHLLGSLDERVLRYLPISSADSATAIRRSNDPCWEKGYWVPPSAGQRAAVAADVAEAIIPPSRWERPPFTIRETAPLFEMLV